MTKQTTKNYRCKKCGYYQDFEATVEKMKKHFPEMDLETGQCPSCREGVLEEEKQIRRE